MGNIKDLESVEKFIKENNIVITTNDLVNLIEQKTGKKWKFKEMYYSYCTNDSAFGHYTAGLVFYNENYRYFKSIDNEIGNIQVRARSARFWLESPNTANYLYDIIQDKEIYLVCSQTDYPIYCEEWKDISSKKVAEKYFEMIQNANWAVSYISKAKNKYNHEIVNIKDNKIGPLIYETVGEYINSLMKESQKEGEDKQSEEIEQC